MQLTQEQINHFHSNGFIILKNFTDITLCDEILEKAQYHLRNKISPIESEQEYLHNEDKQITVRRLRQVYDREEVFRIWMGHKSIQDILKTLLKSEPIITLAHHNSIMTKIPKESSRTFWHQDRRYWHFENDNLISVWLSLGDEFLENGLLEFIPKSHRMNFLPEQFDKDSNFLDFHPKNKELIKSKVHTALSKGDIVLFHCKTLHHANKNKTNKPKISFVYTVRAKNNLPIKGTKSDFKEVIVP